ncbi:MAG: hypothetical protein Q7S92_07175 [Candidatus Diapherotrites archaeon]|nr:hypothetical protein [Candidatus Diapherotrites archaeon]
MNSRGQAFSTFQLLIAAIVAIAILAILFQIIGIIPGIGQQEPSSNAANLVKDLVNKPYTPKTSSQVTFKSGDSINVKAIAAASQAGATEENIILSLGDFEGTTGFEGSGSLITYTAGSSKNVKLWAVCSPKGEIGTTVQSLGPSEKIRAASESCTTDSDEDICCLIALRTTGSG